MLYASSRRFDVRPIAVAGLGAVAGLAAFLAAGPARSEPIGWILGSSGNSGANQSTAQSFGSGAGNRMVFTRTNGGEKVEAKAYSLDSASSGLEAAQLQRYGSGLGVTYRNQSELNGTGANDHAGSGSEIDNSPNHTTDNNVRFELVIFKLGEDSYDPLSMVVNAFGSRVAPSKIGNAPNANNTNSSFGSNAGDMDVTFFVGGALTDFESGGDAFAGFAGKTLDQLVSTYGFVRHDSDDANSGNSRTVSLDPNDESELGRYLIVAAQIDDAVLGQYTWRCGGTRSNPVYCQKPISDRNDHFKIYSLTGVAIEVPEPASIALFAGGLAGLGWMRRRRKSA